MGIEEDAKKQKRVPIGPRGLYRGQVRVRKSFITNNMRIMAVSQCRKAEGIYVDRNKKGRLNVQI